MMQGRMMQVPLTLRQVLERAGTLFADEEVVSREADGSISRTTYGAIYARAARLANMLTSLGIKPGDRVATLAWNHARHLEAYLAVPAMGAVLHTLNLRLHPDEIGYIARHAEDKIVLVDTSLLPLLEQFRSKVPSIEHVIVFDDKGPEGYEARLSRASDRWEWKDPDENAAAGICYTSGTTGNPKGVVYSHRSSFLHTLCVCTTDALAVSNATVAMPVVPMFHANAWGLAYACAYVGAKIVFPGPKLDPISLLDLMAAEKVTCAGGVPTIWLGILAAIDAEPKRWDLSALKQMVVGGSAAPPAMIQGFLDRHGIEVLHAWGMTEMSPIGTVARLKGKLRNADPVAKLRARSTQGYPAPMVEIRHVADDGKILPRDGESMGELEVKGPFVAASYLGGEGADRFTKDGWFKTGDVVTLDPQGYVTICDRSKDVIKSGGEWISSVALENAIMSHPSVLEAAVFAARHPKWDERPIAAVVPKAGKSVTEADLRAHLEGKVSKIWMPDAYVFVEQIPRTSTGKFLKSKLRETYGGMLEKA